MRKDGEKWVCETLEEVANLCSVTRATVKEWRRRGMPGEPGAFATAPIFRWLFTRGPWRRTARPEVVAAFEKG